MNRLVMGTGRLRARKNHVGFLLVKKVVIRYLKKFEPVSFGFLCKLYFEGFYQNNGSIPLECNTYRFDQKGIGIINNFHSFDVY